MKKLSLRCFSNTQRNETLYLSDEISYDATVCNDVDEFIEKLNLNANSNCAQKRRNKNNERKRRNDMGNNINSNTVHKDTGLSSILPFASTETDAFHNSVREAAILSPSAPLLSLLFFTVNILLNHY